MKTWVEAALVSEFEQTDRKLVDLGGHREIGLFKVDGQYYAVDAYCSHQQVSMVQGEVEGHELMCPMHGARFDLRTGAALALPATRGVDTYKVKVDGDRILLEI